MLPEINRIKGVHPGAIIKRELKSRGIKAKALAEEIDEFPQTISAIMNGRRGINPKLSITLGEYFEVSPDYFMILQACNDIRKIQSESLDNSLIMHFNPALFWDIAIEELDRANHKRFIIQRIIERGSATDVEYLKSIYNPEEIKDVLLSLPPPFVPTFEQRAKDVLNSLREDYEIA